MLIIIPVRLLLVHTWSTPRDLHTWGSAQSRGEINLLPLQRRCHPPSSGCQSSPPWQRCGFQISPLPPLIKATVGETHLYSWWETMPLLPPRDWFSPLKRALCLKILHPLCYAKEKMEDFQFNLGWAEGWSAIWASIVPAEPAGMTLASPKRQLSRTERRTGIIDRQEKGSSHHWKRKSKRERAAGRRSEGWEGGREVITCNMLPSLNSDYMKCSAHVHDFGPQAPTRQWAAWLRAGGNLWCHLVLVD